jgi:hypothetical protein
MKIRERLVAKRDAFEQMFRDLNADLLLHPAFDRGVYGCF